VNIVEQSYSKQNKNIEGRDRTHALRARRLLKDKIILFEKTLDLQHMSLALLAENGSAVPVHSHVATALFARAFNTQRAMCNLLIKGYYQDANALARVAFESLDLAVYCSISEEHTLNWVRGKQIRHGQIRAFLKASLPKEVYGLLSEYIHSGSSAVIPSIDLNQVSSTEGGMTIHLLGNWNEQELRAGFDLLQRTAIYALLAMGSVYKDVLVKYDYWRIGYEHLLATLYLEQISNTSKEDANI
jgi:hypothetical protein